jgi:hypothetical protein
MIKELRALGLEAVLKHNKELNTDLPQETDSIAGISRVKLLKKLKDSPKTITQLAEIFDRSPQTIEAAIVQLERTHNVLRTRRTVSISTTEKPIIDFKPNFTLADLGTGIELNIGLDSDLHAGGNQSQPSALNRFREIAYKEFGVRVFLKSGDLTQGIYMYRGWTEDIIPISKPIDRPNSYWTSKFQGELVDAYYGPPQSDVKHFFIGGNHDWSHVVTHGYDPIRVLADSRKDFYFLGYDVGSIPLTDKVHIRLWHPSGGQAYAKSYRIQKGQETQSLEAMKNAMNNAGSLMTSILIAGHLHIAIYLPTLPMVGVHPGCFCATTSYEKRKGYQSDLGGTIMKLRLGDNGRVQRVAFEFIAFDEIKDDYKAWPIPDFGPQYSSPSDVETMFALGERKEPSYKDATGFSKVPRDGGKRDEFRGRGRQ